MSEVPNSEEKGTVLTRARILWVDVLKRVLPPSEDEEDAQVTVTPVRKEPESHRKVDTEVTTVPQLQTLVYQPLRRSRCFRCLRWYCDLTTPNCQCFCCMFCLMLIALLISIAIIKYLSWRLEHGGSLWNAILGEFVGWPFGASG